MVGREETRDESTLRRSSRMKEHFGIPEWPVMLSIRFFELDR
jgi:hypothetical protein